ncbi:hypothetical protein GCM10007989_23640 [Devosia pacifica]|uniref:OmpR/PhoB-type domain-containing protein n=1 Tax=Devosia pacifica TaxID=1335967 RepID=A0A918S766_9HYPH|nr:transcriptional regulator [Devosia pacifica]GHA27084.1 hypothetical protein GCM10007989_23640 [Devosia pacifica]
MAPVYRFADFVLDTGNRRLIRGGSPVALSARYFDALVLLVSEAGRLVEKQRFFDEVWGGAVVGDEALTQCVKTIRKCLGDAASSPRFIETVPKHGYRFVGDVHGCVHPGATAGMASLRARFCLLAMTLFGVAGGGSAGLLGGLLYGGAIAYGAEVREGASAVLVLLIALNVIVGATGAFGVCLGAALAKRLIGRAEWLPLGGAIGGAAIGWATQTLGIDAFTLALGFAPTRLTGAVEGVALGMAVGFGLWLEMRWRGWKGVGASGAICAVIGGLIVQSGGTLMAGSLFSLSQSFELTPRVLDRLSPFADSIAHLASWHVALGAVEAGIFGSLVILGASLRHGTLSLRSGGGGAPILRRKS